MLFMNNNLYYVSSNKFKLQMTQKFFDKFAPEINLIQATLDFIEPQIDNQIDIAVLKAKQAYLKYQKPLLVDDIGFYFDKYNNFPGTITGLVSKGLSYEGIKRLYDIGDTGFLRIIIVYITNIDEYKIFDCKTDCSLIKPAKIIDDTNNVFIQIGIPIGYNQTIYDLMPTDFFYDVMPRNKALKQFLNYYKN